MHAKTSVVATDPPHPPRASHEGVKETVESIVVAFILAFVFRAFVVEAFVIPTGSMASTLYGKHGTMTCENCGWEYAYGLTDPAMKRERWVTPSSTSRCPNCGWSNRTSEFYDRAAQPSVEAGDRILVLKWPFAIGGPWLGPRRWDVTVFKNPRDGEENFIKRLVGLPGEVLAIIDGDVYTAPTDTLSAQARGILHKICRLKYLLLQLDQHKHRDKNPGLRDAGIAALHEQREQIRRYADEADRLHEEITRERPALLAELDDKLRITRKTRSAQQALWTVVYDADFPFRQRVPVRTRWWKPRASSDSHWVLTGRRWIFHGVRAPEETLELAGPTIDNFSGYNIPNPRGPSGGYAPVRDLRLRCVVTRQNGEGYLRFSLSRRGRTFFAVIHADGAVSIQAMRGHEPAGADVLARAQVAPLHPGDPVEVAFENVDFRVALWVDGREIIAVPWIRSPGEPDTRREAEHWITISEIRTIGEPSVPDPPAISASDIELEVIHVALQRDAYYVTPPLDQAPFPGYKLGAWGTTSCPILLREGEYFMLGDNSPQSADSRLWRDVGSHLLRRGEAYQLGTVPEDQLIGRAFFVYWPSGHRSDLVPIPALRRLGWIPNVGRMRWIR